MTNNVARLALQIFLKALILSLSVPAMGQVLTAETTTGVYQGRGSSVVSAVTEFLGIQYAAPPIRDLRWRPPVAAIPFAGVRTANEVGPACWQVQNSDASIYARGDLERSEDCLYLNTFSGAAQPSDSLPVMVWFHGGSNTAGHAGAKIFDGANLAARGAVVVTANYRLGPLGFLAHPGLTDESEHSSSGNYGLLDQVAVLEWVRSNIAKFGGDANRVTIFGQSAGGTDVCLLMASPLAEGLIDGVIGQSPGCIKLTRGLNDGENSGHQLGIRFANQLKLSGSSASVVQQLRALDPATVTAAPGVGGATIIDGWVVPQAPYQAFADGALNRIPIMVGALADENFGLMQLAPSINAEQLSEYLDASFGSSAPQVKRSYRSIIETSPSDARKEIAADNSFLLSSRMWARLVRERGDSAFVYYFSRPAPVFRLYRPELPDVNSDGGARTLGAYHSADLAYVFNTTTLVGIGWDDADHALSNLMADYWVSFASNGNPNRDGLPPWPVYDPVADNVQVFDERPGAREHPKKAQLDLLEEIYLRQAQ
ncbi:MAG: para-nitrobenzyl esterase [Pseudohongiellaceae bacterium]|jgi:para-nitrobenzyl esterase